LRRICLSCIAKATFEWLFGYAREVTQVNLELLPTKSRIMRS